MRTGTVRFQGWAGGHSGESIEKCSGRDFKVIVRGSGAAYFNVVQCCACRKLFDAIDERLMCEAGGLIKPASK